MTQDVKVVTDRTGRPALLEFFVYYLYWFPVFICSVPCLDRARSTPGFRCVSPHHDIAVLTDAFTDKTNMLLKSPELSVIHLYYIAATSSRHDA